MLLFIVVVYSLSEMVAEGIINVVSPTALAGSMRVDSVHLPGTVPTLVSSMEVGTLDVTLLNHYEPKGKFVTYDVVIAFCYIYLTCNLL